MTGAACVSKERVPASLRIRPKSPRNHVQFIPSRFGARCGRAGRRSHVSYDGRSVRFQRARARFPAHPLERSACKSGSDFSFFPKAPEIRATIRRQRPAEFPFRLLKLPGSRKRENRLPATVQAIVPGAWEPLNQSAAALSGSFAPTYRFENLEIRKGFLRFPNLNLEQNPSLTTLAIESKLPLAKQLARGGARPPRPSGKTAARGVCRNMALQILRAVVYLSLMTVCGTGLSPCRTNAKGTQNARENFLLHF